MLLLKRNCPKTLQIILEILHYYSGISGVIPLSSTTRLFPWTEFRQVIRTLELSLISSSECQINESKFPKFSESMSLVAEK